MQPSLNMGSHGNQTKDENSKTVVTVQAWFVAVLSFLVLWLLSCMMLMIHTVSFHTISTGVIVIVVPRLRLFCRMRISISIGISVSIPNTIISTTMRRRRRRRSSGNSSSSSSYTSKHFSISIEKKLCLFLRFLLLVAGRVLMRAFSAS